MVSASRDIELLVDPRSKSAESKNVSCFSFEGDAINVMLRGSEVPLNQFASFPGLLSDLACKDSSLASECSNIAASSGDTGSGEMDRSWLSLRNGRKVDDRDGEIDPLEGGSDAQSLVALDR